MTSARLLDLGARLAQALASEGGRDAVLRELDRGTGLRLLDARQHSVAQSGSPAPTVPSELPESTEPVAFGDGSLALPLSIGGERLGWLVAYGPNERRAETDALRLAATLLALDLSRDRRAGDRRDLWDAALSGSLAGAAAAKALAAEHRIVVASTYLVVALTFDEAGETCELAELGALACEALGQRGIAVRERDGAALLLCPATEEPTIGKMRVAATLLPKSIARRHAAYRIVGGIGGARPLHELDIAAREALAALEIARRLRRHDTVLAYEKLGALPLLFQAAVAPEWRGFARDYLESIRDYDAKHQTELERTMTTYFEAGENVKVAAEQLHVHRHTVFYRLRQIAELTGLSLENPFDQLNLRLAVTIDALDA